MSISKEQYSYLTVFWKSVRSFLAVAAPGQVALVSLPETPMEFSESWPIYLTALLIAASRAFKNVWKNREKPGNPIYLFNQYRKSSAGGTTPLPSSLVPLLAFLLLLPLGCATSVSTRFSETITDENGFPSTTEYEVKSRGDVDATVHEMVYKWGGVENTIAIGQSAQGITSPAQTDAIRALLSLPPDVLRSLIPVGGNK